MKVYNLQVNTGDFRWTNFGYFRRKEKAENTLFLKHPEARNQEWIKRDDGWALDMTIDGIRSHVRIYEHIVK